MGLTKTQRLAAEKYTRAEGIERTAAKILAIPPFPVKRLLKARRRLARMLERAATFGVRPRRVQRLSYRVNGLGYSAAEQARRAKEAAEEAAKGEP